MIEASLPTGKATIHASAVLGAAAAVVSAIVVVVQIDTVARVLSPNGDVVVTGGGATLAVSPMAVTGKVAHVHAAIIVLVGAAIQVAGAYASIVLVPVGTRALLPPGGGA